MRNKSRDEKCIYTNGIKSKVSNINAYLVDSTNAYVNGVRKPINSLPPIFKGNAGYDENNLIVEKEEKEELLRKHPDAARFIKKYIGAKELINNLERYCLWIEGEQLPEAQQIEFIRNRVDAVKAYRLSSNRAGTKKAAETSYAFAENRHQHKDSLVIPVISSEARKYIPIESFDKNTVSGYANFMVYDYEPFLFGLLTSQMHNTWVKAVCGSLETRIRYSNTICYNTFPVPKLSQEEKDHLSTLSNKIVRERIMNGGTLAELYDPKKMPESLLTAHKNLDIYVDSLYQKDSSRSKAISTDSERLEVLFKMYADMKEQQ